VKKALGLFLAQGLLLPMAGCKTDGSMSPRGPVSQVVYKAGGYVATSGGKNGPVTVEVSFSSSRIEKITVQPSEETPGISDKPIAEIPRKVVASQSLAVDTVAGASYTSRAILSAIEECVRQAGADPAILKARKTAQTGKGQDEAISTEVVVVGAGASGTSAALTALQGGAKVILLEKTASPSSAGTAGASMFAANSSLQKANKEYVDPKWLYDQYMLTSNYHANGALVKAIIDRSAETVDWLIGNGVRLTNLPAGMASSSVKMERENPATANSYVDGGIPAITGLHEMFRKAGGELRYETPAFELLQKNGVVCGVKAKKPDGGTLVVNAKSVIIATGGFANNPEMVKEYFPNDKLGTEDVVAGAQGDGLKMAWSAGAGKTKIIPQNYGVMPKTSGYGDPLMAPLLSPILFVNSQGTRFTNEEVFNEATSGANTMRALPNEDLYSIFDGKLVDIVKEKGVNGLIDVDSAFIGKPRTYVEVGWKTDSDERREEANRPVDLSGRLQELVDAGLIVKADSIEDLSAKLHMPKLAGTVSRYNALCAQGKDTDFYKDAKYLRAVDRGPYYAAKYEFVNFIGTLGGTLVDETLQACRKDGSPIGSLWVVGLDAGGMYGDSYVYFEGGTLGFAYTSGRIAGERAAASAKRLK